MSGAAVQRRSWRFFAPTPHSNTAFTASVRFTRPSPSTSMHFTSFSQLRSSFYFFPTICFSFSLTCSTPTRNSSTLSLPLHDVLRIVKTFLRSSCSFFSTLMLDKSVTTALCSFDERLNVYMLRATFSSYSSSMVSGVICEVIHGCLSNYSAVSLSSGF